MRFLEHAVRLARLAVLMPALSVALVFAGNVRAHEEPTGTPTKAPAEAAKGEEHSGRPPSGFEVEFFPSGSFYAPYLADPHRIGFGLQVLHYTHARIPHSGSTRFDLRTGGQFGLIRMHPKGSEDLGWQLGLDGGFNAQFDIETKLDNIGWDGRYGLVLTNARTPSLSFKLGLQHDSSHVGDEYAERNGRERIGYTREEIAAGVSWVSDSGWRTYAEYGHGVVLRNEDQEPGRVQFGLEWQSRKAGGGWYAGADLSATEERDWKVDVSLQTGYRVETRDKDWRFAINWYNGRPPIGEFFQHTESYLGFGVWVDL